MNNILKSVIILFIITLCVIGTKTLSQTESNPIILQNEINENVWFPCIMIAAEYNNEEMPKGELIKFLENKEQGSWDKQLLGLVSGAEKENRYAFYNMYRKLCLERNGIEVDAENNLGNNNE